VTIDTFPVTKPTLLLDEIRARRNITNMVQRAARGGVRLRPHFKTHQSAVVGHWFREQGIDTITVSSLDQGRYFAAHDWSNLTVAFPVNLRQLARIDALAAAVRLGLLVDTEEAVRALQETVTHPVRVWLKIDTGYGRVGVFWEDSARILALARLIAGAPQLEFAGLLTHSGQTYRAASVVEIHDIHVQTVANLRGLRDVLERDGIGPCEISIGDTPSCSVAADYTGVDEIRPGNFVYYDLMQEALGVCQDTDIAVAVACPVVGKYPRRNEIAIYGGAVHLGQDSLILPGGERIHGYLAQPVAMDLGRAQRQAPVVSLSQEHGLVRIPEPLLAEISIGDVVTIFPIHSCLTCALHREYRTLTGETISRL
jgi:D-serine deaminase-like pyridoxal phosphate-dependent protein